MGCLLAEFCGRENKASERLLFPNLVNCRNRGVRRNCLAVKLVQLSSAEFEDRWAPGRDFHQAAGK